MQVNFHTALYQLNLLYGIELDEDTFEEIGLIAWNYIGNKQTRLHKYSTCIGPDLSVELPCNADIIEAVTINEEDWNRVTNKHEGGDLNSMIVEYDLEAQREQTDPLYISGRYVDYTRVGDILYFKENYGIVNILYKGIVLDEDGLPYINEKEAVAIATYCAYVIKYKESIATNNQNLAVLATSIKQDWLIKCDQARVPEYINQNDMDAILEVKSNSNRKIHGHSYKPII